MKQEEGERIVAERQKAAFTSLADFQLRARISKASERALASAGALNGLADHRRDAQWQVEVLRDPDDLFGRVEMEDSTPLQMMNEFERVQADYANTGLTTGPHPMRWVRNQLADDEQVWRAVDLEQAEHGTRLRIGGMVICRQRPGTAKGFVFISLEDETGVANAIVTPQLFEKERLLITTEQFLMIEGILQNVERVIHVKALQIKPLLYPGLSGATSHDFH
jgi:error-prone DNA polymerase